MEELIQKRVRLYRLIPEVLESSGLKYEYHDQYSAYTVTLTDGRDEYLVIVSFSDEDRWVHINAIFPHRADLSLSERMCVVINDLNRKYHTTAPLQYCPENGEIVANIHIFAPDGTTKNTIAMSINACLETLTECRAELLQAMGR